MELVYCPNGHPNRPGTRICAVCRALVEPHPPSSPAASEPPRWSPVPGPDENITPPEGEPSPVAATPQKDKRPWLWVVLLLLLLGGLAVGAFLEISFPFLNVSPAQPTPRPDFTMVAVFEATELPIPTTPPESTPPELMATTSISPTPGEIVSELPTAVSTITPLSTDIGVAATPTFSFDPGINLLQNGDFANDWANGWSSEMNGISSFIETRPFPDEPGVMTVHLENTGSGYLKLTQRVVLTFPVEGLEFQARIRATGAGAAVESRGMLILRYEDMGGVPLGVSVWLDGAAESTGLWETSVLPPASIPSIVRSLDEDWQTLTVDLGREFTDELDGVNPSNVAQIIVILAVIGDDTCIPGGCAATLDIAQLSLSPGLP